jgi:hypothetical protein
MRCVLGQLNVVFEPEFLQQSLRVNSNIPLPRYLSGVFLFSATDGP